MALVVIVTHLLMQVDEEMWGVDPWVGKTPWSRKWQSAPVFLPEESHGQRNLASSPWGCKESDMTEVTQHACAIGVHTFN